MAVATMSENTTYTARYGMDSLLGISSATISCTKRKPSSTVTARLILSPANGGRNTVNNPIAATISTGVIRLYR